MDPMTLMAAGQAAGKIAKTGVGLATSAVQKSKANKLKREAEGLMPDMVDPNMASYLAELAEKKRSIETGAEFASSMRNIDQTTAGTQEALTRASGGDVGGTMQALLQSQQVASRAKNDALSMGQRNQLAYTGMYGDVLKRIEQRKLELQMQRAQQRTAEWAAMQKGATQNFMGAMGTAPEGAAGVKGLMDVLKSLNPTQQPTAPGESGTDLGSAPYSSDGVNMDASGKPSIDKPTAETPDINSILGNLGGGLN